MNATLANRPDRQHLEECGICHAPPGHPCDREGVEHSGRRWRVALTAPRLDNGTGFGSSHLNPDGGPCRPTIEDTYWWDHTRRDDRFGHESVRVAIVHRGACLGCGWAGPTRCDENAAVEDAHDHTWPGWRDLPIVPRQPHDAKPKDLVRWRATCTALYTAAGLDAAHWTQQYAPFRTARSAMGTRSHTTWHGGYDICGSVTDNPHPPTRRRAVPEPAAQLALW